MNVDKTLWMAALCAGLCLGGCESRRRIDTGAQAREQLVPTELVARSRSWVPDVPVPLQFDLDQTQSRSWATGGIRWVHHRYVGPSDKWAVGRFYQRQMKNSQWTPVSDRMVLGALSLRFVKGDERCEVDIRDTRWASTEVVVTIYPENATTVKRQY